MTTVNNDFGNVCNGTTIGLRRRISGVCMYVHDPCCRDSNEDLLLSVVSIPVRGARRVSISVRETRIYIFLRNNIWTLHIDETCNSGETPFVSVSSFVEFNINDIHKLAVESRLRMSRNQE